MTAAPDPWFGGDFELVDVGGADAVEVIEVPARDALGEVELVDVRDVAPGASAGTSTVHRFVQDEPATRWVIATDLGRPAVPLALYDAEGRLRSQWNASHPTVNQLVIDFDVPAVGALDYL